jgi:hypothetical protein
MIIYGFVFFEGSNLSDFVPPVAESDDGSSKYGMDGMEYF